MNTLAAVGYGILAVTVTVMTATLAWDTWHHQRRTTPPAPPFPRPPADTHGVTMDPRWSPTHVDRPPAQPATPTNPSTGCRCPKCDP